MNTNIVQQEPLSYTGHMHERSLQHRLLRILVTGGFTLAFMMLSRPSEVPAVLLVVPFISIFCLLYFVFLEVIKFLGPDSDENGAIIRVPRPRLLSAVLAGFPVLLLVLQSIVELTLWDVLIALTIVVLAYIYISRSSVSLWR